MWSFYVILQAVPLVTLTPSSTVAEMLSAHFQLKGGDNVELQGLANKVVRVNNMWECAHSCMKNIYCMSFNLGRLNDGTSDYNCVHNIDTVEQSGLSLVTRDGYQYYEQTVKAPLLPAITAAAYDETTKYTYLLYNNSLYQFSGPIGDISFIASCNGPGYDVTGLLVRPNMWSNPNAQLFTAYLGDGTMVNATYNMATHAWHFSAAVNINIHHGPLAPERVDGVVRLGGTLYLIHDDIVYETDAGEIVIASFHVREQARGNPFSGAPLGITAVCEINFLHVYFFKGTRFYVYEYINKKFEFGGNFVDDKSGQYFVSLQ